MDILFKLKHWQAFIILIIPYIIGMVSWSDYFSFGQTTALNISATSIVIFLSLFFFWIMSIGLVLNKIQENQYRLKKWILIPSILISIVGYANLNFERLKIEQITVPYSISMILTPFVLFGVLYIFINIPRSLKSAELGRKVIFTEWILYSLLIFFFPIGVWFIQPRLNRIYTNHKVL